jgi:aminopeptidase N
MRQIVRVTHLLTAGVVFASSIVAQSQPSRTGGRRAGVDALHYTFRVGFPARHGVPDVVHIASTVLARRTAGTDSLRLDLADAMQVDSVRVDGARTAFTRTSEAVRVALPGTVETVRVTVFAHGAPTDGLIIRADSGVGWTAFGDNFPDRARQWLAVVDHPSDKATVEWIVRAPATHRVIANGTMAEPPVTDTVDGVLMTITRWNTTQPIYTAVMVIGVAPFVVTTLDTGACPLADTLPCPQQTLWTLPAHRAAVPGVFTKAPDIVRFFSERIGAFPYSALAHVASSTRYGGMENAAAIFYASNLFAGNRVRESLVAHETAHQWFGDAVTTREWPHVWLSEGFATYFAALWMEHAHGDSVFRAELTRMRSQVLTAPITATTPVINEELSDLRQVLSSNVYQRAGFVLHMLRRDIGDSAFFTGIRRYYAAYQHRNALTSDLQRHMEQAAGRPLDWFFAQWLRRKGLPELSPAWTYDAPARALQLTVRQTHPGDPYRIRLTLQVRDAAGAEERVIANVNGTATSVVTVPLSRVGTPVQVTFDPDVSFLGTIRR